MTVNKNQLLSDIMDLVNRSTSSHHSVNAPLPEMEGCKIIALAHDIAQHDPSSVEYSYSQLKTWLEKQYKIISKYIYVLPWRDENEPYASRQDMHDQVFNYSLFYYLPTNLQYGQNDGQNDDNLMLQLTNCRNNNGQRMCLNDVFRVVHDIIGHFLTEFGFSGRGEFNAMLSHRSTLPAECYPALYCETACQTIWFEFGPHLWRKDGSVPVYGNSDWLPRNERPFSEQKNYYPKIATQIITDYLLYSRYN